MTQRKHIINVAELKQIAQDQPDLLRPLIQAVLQEVLETEMDEALQAVSMSAVPSDWAIAVATTAGAW